MLTAIVIGFATTGFVIELALRSRHENGSDHVDAPARRRRSRDRERAGPHHLPILPVLLPSLTAIVLLLIGDHGGDAHGGHGHRRLLWARRIALGSAALGLLLAARLVLDADARRRCASTASATGRRPSASCWWSTGSAR